jgi:DNA-binding transcriptional ArsR family regulator
MTDYPAPDIDEVALVDVMRALGDPIRLQIVRMLGDGRPHPKTESGWEFPVRKSTLSHHFKTLREAGLTRTLVTGRTHTIELRRAELDARFPGLLDAVIAGTRPLGPRD